MSRCLASAHAPHTFLDKAARDATQSTPVSGGGIPCPLEPVRGDLGCGGRGRSDDSAVHASGTAGDGSPRLCQHADDIAPEAGVVRRQEPNPRFAPPAEGVMNQLTGRLQNKLTALGPLLRAVDRDAVYDVRVVDIPLARIGLYERTVLLISGTALALLPAEDLRAQVAHEIGHEYFATEHDRATKAGDRRRLRELELMCDAVGMVMLHDLGMDPSRLVRSIEKVTLYNRRMLQTAVDESGYPTLDERQKFATAVRRWIVKRKAGASHEIGRSVQGTPQQG